GEIREHVRGRCGVLPCSRQPSRLLEWNACRFRLAEQIERLPQTEESLPPPAAGWAFNLDRALSPLGGDLGTSGEVDRTDDGDARLERCDSVCERSVSRSRRGDFEPALDLIGGTSRLTRDRGPDDGQLRLGLGRRP